MSVAVPLLWGVPPASETLHVAVRSGGGIVDKIYWQWDLFQMSRAKTLTKLIHAVYIYSRSNSLHALCRNCKLNLYLYRPGHPCAYIVARSVPQKSTQKSFHLIKDYINQASNPATNRSKQRFSRNRTGPKGVFGWWDGGGWSRSIPTFTAFGS